jgi:hypothetical protein
LNDSHKHFLILGLACLELVCPVVVVIINQASIGSFVLLSQFNPMMNFLKDFRLLDVEMPLNDRFESLRRSFYLLNHSKLDVAVSHNVLISFVLFLTFRSTSFILESWFVKVNFFGHDDGLGREKNL